MHLHMDVMLRRQGSLDFITANDVCGRSDLVYSQCQAWHIEEVLRSYKALSFFQDLKKRGFQAVPEGPVLHDMVLLAPEEEKSCD